MNENQATKVVTGKVRFSYLHVWEPAAVEEGSQKKYSVSLIIPKSDTDTVSRIKNAIQSALEAGKAKFGGKIPASLKLPLRDGDIERADDDAYLNSWFLNANSSKQPGIVDQNVQPILRQDELYSGCYGRASINFFAFNTNGNKGIACGLNNVQKLSDGELLGGRATAEFDFADDCSDIL
ncbi:DUF2815 family protein [bacterium]|nr:DUF2815 family protein [bacterium]